MGFDVTHVYGLTEVYGPAAVCAKHAEWDDAAVGEQARAERRARACATTLQEGMTVLDPETMQPVPRDGETMGEIMFRGNIVMKGYLKNPTATRRGLRRRLVPHRRPGGDAPRRLRQDQGPLARTSSSPAARTSRSIEVEDVLYRHPAVLACRGGGAARREVGRDAVRLRRDSSPAPR